MNFQLVIFPPVGQLLCFILYQLLLGSIDKIELHCCL